MLRRIVAAAAILFIAGAAQAADTTPDDASKRLIEARAVEAVIWGMPAVNYDLMLQESNGSAARKTRSFIGRARSMATTRR